MATPIKITPGTGLTIKYNGVFDFEKIYNDLHDWFIANRYGFNEKEHTKKTKDLGSNLELKWSGDKKIDDYAMYTIDLHLLIEEMNKEGKLDSGKLTIEIIATVTLDYTNKWSTKPFSNLLHQIYTKYIIKDKINGHYIGGLYGEAVNLQDTAKALLNLYS